MLQKTIKQEDFLKENFKCADIEVMTEYMPYAEKLKYATSIIEESATTNKYGYLSIDFHKLHMLEALYKVYLFTNIELVDFTVEAYDIIKKYDLEDQIDFMHDLCDPLNFSDVLNNEVETLESAHNLENVLAKMSENSFALLLDIGDHVNKMLDKGDPNKMAKYLSKGIEMLAKKLPDLSQFDVQHYLETVKESKSEEEPKVDMNEIN